MLSPFFDAVPNFKTLQNLGKLSFLFAIKDKNV